MHGRAERLAAAGRMSKLTRQFREKRAVAEIGMCPLNLIAQHAFEREVLEDGDDVSETFVKRVNVGVARLAKATAAGVRVRA